MNQESSQNEERRDFFRFDDRVALTYRALNEKELSEAMEEFEREGPDLKSVASSIAATNAQMRRGLERFRPKFPELAAYLEGLNDKVDLMIQLTGAGMNAHADEPTHEVSLSGSGLAFMSDNPIPFEQALEIRLMLFPEHYSILAFGRVVRCEQVRELPTTGFEVGVRFTRILEADRDLVVRHILQRQSSQIREAKNESS